MATELLSLEGLVSKARSTLGVTQDSGPGLEATAATPGPEGDRSKKEAVLACLREHEGQVRQQVVVERLKFSSSTVSRVLIEMEEKGAIERVKRGREKVVAMP